MYRGKGPPGPGYQRVTIGLPTVTPMVRTLMIGVPTDTFDLTMLETEHLLINGFKSAFLPEKEKRTLTQEAIETFGSLRDKYALDERVAGRI